MPASRGLDPLFTCTCADAFAKGAQAANVMQSGEVECEDPFDVLETGPRAEVEGVSGLDKAGRERMQICEGVGVARTNRVKMIGMSYQPTANACCTFVDLVLQRAAGPCTRQRAPSPHP